MSARSGRSRATATRLVTPTSRRRVATSRISAQTSTVSIERGLRRALIDAELAGIAVQNEWEGLVVYGSVRQVDDLEDLDIGIQAIAAIPVGAAGDGIGESDVRVNFGGVTFFSGDHLYADNTGIILSEDALDIE